MSPNMLIRKRAMSNVERQRAFQARHPGYDARRKARQRSAVRAYLARKLAERHAAAAAAKQQALAEASAASTGVSVRPPPPPLPASAVGPALPGPNEIAPTEQVAERQAA
jgi:hypothetical protein